jgi:hypothetical protein
MCINTTLTNEWSVQYFVNLSQICNCKTNRSQHKFSVLFVHNKILTEHREHLKNVTVIVIFIFYNFLKLLQILQQYKILNPTCVTYDLMILIHNTLVYKISMSRVKRYEVYTLSSWGKLSMKDSLQMTLAMKF